MREVLGFEARLLLRLPAATTLLCYTAQTDRTIVVTTSRVVYVAARARGVATIIGREWVAVVRSTEQDRMWPSDVERLIDSKLGQAHYRFWDVDLEPERWIVERVLRRVGLVLHDVSAGDDVPVLLTVMRTLAANDVEPDANPRGGRR
jgi:hypothetical protein